MLLASLALGFSWQAGPLEAIENAYHLKVEEIQQPLDWRGRGYKVAGRPATADQLKVYEPLFVKEWTLYPPSLIQKAKVLRIVIAADLAVDGQVRGAVPAFDGNTMYYDPALGAYNPHYQRIVIHHEFFHMVDERIGKMRRDPEWAKLNPADFKYGSGGAKMRTSGVGELTDTIPAFITPYGTSAVEEDKAELFAHLVVDGPWVKDRAAKDPALAAKIALLKERLVKFDPAMGDEFWKKVDGGS